VTVLNNIIETASTEDRSEPLWCLEGAALIRTTDDASSRAIFGRVSLAVYTGCTSFIPLDWKAGQHSSTHRVILTRSDIMFTDSNVIAQAESPDKY
jgi:hypothetical protein